MSGAYVLPSIAATNVVLESVEMYHSAVAEAESVDKLERHSHVIGIDREHLIVNFGIIDVPARVIDLACVHTERDNGSIVKDPAGIENTDERAIVRVTYRPGFRDNGRKPFGAGPATRSRLGEKSTLPASKIRYELLSKFAVRAPGPAFVSLAETFSPSREATPGSSVSVRMYQTGT